MAKTGPKGPSKYTPQYVDALAPKLLAFVEEYETKGIFPTKSRFCALQGFSRHELKDFITPDKSCYSEKFSHALKTFEEKQEANLVENTLAEKYQPSFAIFTAKNVLGWRDEQYLKGEGFNNIFNVIKKPRDRSFQLFNFIFPQIILGDNDI